MAFQSPSIVKLAERMLKEIEQAVRRFARFHKYQHGAVLRARAMVVAELAHKAWRERGSIEHVEALVDAVDNLKIALQLGKEIQAFASFRQFEALGRLQTELGTHRSVWPHNACDIHTLFFAEAEVKHWAGDRLLLQKKR